MNVYLFSVIAFVMVSAAFGSAVVFTQSKGQEVQEPMTDLATQETRGAPDYATLAWERVVDPAPWGPRDSSALVEFQDKLWLLGGINGNGYYLGGESVQYWLAPHMADVWVSENGIDWEQVVETAPWGERRSMNVAAFQGKLLLMGGYGPYIGLKNDVWESEDGIHWELMQRQAEWPAREGAELLVFQDKLWLIGGVDYGARVTYQDVWVSEDGITWEQVQEQAPWQGRWDHAAEVWKDRMWILGGMDLHGSLFRDVWSSEDGIVWQEHAAPAWDARQNGLALVYGDRLWMLGRFNDQVNKGPHDVWFTEDGDTWQKTYADPLWLGREDHVGLVFQDKMWIMGGMDSNWEWRADIWQSSLTQ